MNQYKTPVSMLEQVDHVGRLIALVGKIATVGEYPRSKAQIAHELLELAEAHGTTFDRDVKERLERDAESHPR